MTADVASPALPRLNAVTLAAALPRPGVSGPPPGELGRRIGILHLGIGAFHRAHQAVFTEDAAAAAGEDGWGICGVTQRSARVADQLQPQNCRYGVLERAAESASLRVVGQVGEVLFPARDGKQLANRFDDPQVRVVTLTVTEKAYRADSPALALLVRGLQRRAVGCDAPVTVLTCDNLTGNGQVLHSLVSASAAALPGRQGEALTEWIAGRVTFPSSMVDRIVPATTAADRADAAALLGLADAGLVVAEPFRQWVIEDRFAAGRPGWELAGVQLVPDVAPYEQLKLRALNGTHSLLAYLGALAGYATVAEAVRDPALAHAAEQLVLQDVAPTLEPPPGVDVAAYGRTVLQRFANPALRHRTTQVAMDGSQKLPPRLLGTVRDGLAAGRTPWWAVRGVAAWMAYVSLGVSTGQDGRDGRMPLDDPMAARLRAAVAGARGAAAIVAALLALSEIFDADLAHDARFRDCVTEQLAQLLAGHPAGRA